MLRINRTLTQKSVKAFQQQFKGGVAYSLKPQGEISFNVDTATVRCEESLAGIDTQATSTRSPPRVATFELKKDRTDWVIVSRK